MRRRDFIAGIASTRAVWPIVARAQQTERLRRIGVLMAHKEGDPEFQDYLGAFRQGLREVGWVEGHNIQIDTRWGALDDAQIRRQSANELLALAPDVILSQNTPPTATLLEQTQSVPVVFVIVADPVGSGFVKTLSRPGTNATGFTVMEPTTSGKWMELLKEIAPQIKRAGLLFNPKTAPFADYWLRPFYAAASSLGVEPAAVKVDSESDLETAFAAQANEKDAGMVVMPDGFLNVYRTQIVTLASRYRVPTVYPWRFFSDLGGLMSYGFDQRDSFHTAAVYVDRILKGEKPGDLPVQAPTKYELVINRKAARALDLNVPLSLIGRADDVIQ